VPLRCITIVVILKITNNTYCLVKNKLRCLIFFLSNQYVSIPIRGIKPPTHSNRTEDYSFNYKLNGQVSGNMKYTIVPCIVFFKYQLLERHPFSGRCDSAGKLLHTPYADSNFHGHRPAFCTTRNTLSVYRKVGADNVRPGLS